MDDLKKKLLGNTLANIKNFANSIVKKTGDYFNPESNGGNNFWGSKPLQKYGQSNTAQFVQGLGVGAKRWVQPIGEFVGEAGYQGSRFVFDPTFRKLVLKGPEALTQEELQVQSQPKTKFLKVEQIKDRKEIAKTGISAISKAELGTIGLSNPINALTTAGISGLLGFTVSKLTGSENPYYDAGSAVGYSPVYAGINKLTGVPQANLTEAVVGKGQPLVTKMLTRGTIDAAVNFLTDEIFTPLTESRSPTGQERAISVGTGFVGGAASEGLDSAFKSAKVKVNTLLDKWFPGKDTEFKRDVIRGFARDELGRFTGIDEPTYLSDSTIPNREIRATEGVDISNAKTGDTIKFDQRTGKKFQAAGTLSEAQKKELRTALNLPEDGKYKVPMGLSVKELTKAEHDANIEKMTGLNGNPGTQDEWLNYLGINNSNPLDEVKMAIDSGDLEAAKNIYQSVDGNKPSFESLVAEVDSVHNSELKDATKSIQDKFGEYQDVVNKFKKFLQVAGENKSKQTGELFREHIPQSVTGVSSDEIAASLGMSENEFMAEITKDLKMAGDGKGTPEVMAKIKTKVDKIRDIYSKLDPTKFEVHKDELGRPTGVSTVSSMDSVGKIVKSRLKALETTAKNDYNEWRAQVIKQENLRTTKQLAGDIANSMKESTKSLPAADITGLNDISGISMQWRDVYRNFKAVFGKKYPEVKALILDPFDASKGNFIDNQNTWIKELDKNIIEKYDIQKGSPESRAIQMFGEGIVNESDLVKRFGIDKTKDIVEADKWFRGAYDRLLNEVNKARAVIYKNNPEKLIPRRNDYYRHFRELADGFQGLLNIFDTPAGISSSLSGISEFTKPKSKWLSFAQKRKGIKTQYDAVGGFFDYIKASSYAKNIDPQIQRFDNLADELAKATEEGFGQGKLNNFIEFLRDFSHDLSGKTNPGDRYIQKLGGRKAMRVLDWINNRVKANTILGNLSSSVAQIFNVPQGIASAGPVNSAKGLGRTFLEIFNIEKPQNNSVFLKERYFNSYDKFEPGMLEKGKQFAAWMTGVLDEVGTKYIWNSHYEKALSEGIDNPVKYADDLTRELVAGRGVGEVPLAQKSKVIKLMAPFQLEVANLWWVMKDFVDQKQFSKLATLFLMNHLFNKAAEYIRGSAVTLDPIKAMVEASKTYTQEEDKKIGALKFGGRLAGEVLSNVPFGQSVASTYPENGIKVNDKQLPTRKELFGRADPTRFGSGLLLTKGLQDPLYKVLPPFGGAQLKKTIEGVKTYVKGYSENSTGKVQYPVAQTTSNAVKSIAFGQYATPEAVKYLNSGGQPLGDKQTAMFKQSDQKDKLKVYTDILSSREQGKLEDAARAKVEKLGQTQETANKIFYMEDGEVKSVQKNRQITVKPLTGSKELDSKILSNYRSDLNAKENDIVKLWELGQLPQDEAIKQLQMIKKLKNKLAKPKKAKVIKYKVPKLNKIKASSIKIPKSRTAKLLSKKTKGTTAKLSVSRIWT